MMMETSPLLVDEKKDVTINIGSLISSTHKSKRMQRKESLRQAANDFYDEIATTLRTKFDDYARMMAEQGHASYSWEELGFPPSISERFDHLGYFERQYVIQRLEIHFSLRCDRSGVWYKQPAPWLSICSCVNFAHCFAGMVVVTLLVILCVVVMSHV